MNKNGRSPATSAREHVLKLLGDGIEPKAVAAHLGIGESGISQYLADEKFALELATIRYEKLAAATSRDRKYDSLEDSLLERLEKSLAMVFDPMKLASILRMINMAQRRGNPSMGSTATQVNAPVVLTMPTFVMQRFTTQVNIHNQVIAAIAEDGTQQSMVTIQAESLSKMVGTLASAGEDSRESKRQSARQDALELAHAIMKEPDDAKSLERINQRAS